MRFRLVVSPHWAAQVGVFALGLLAMGCAKNVSLAALPLAQSGKANVKVELTYDRNNTLEVKLEEVPEPSSLKAEYTRYVLWAATPDRQHVVNIGQLRVDEKKKAAIKTLTPFREFRLFITAEAAGDATSPGPDTLFESAEIRW
jgi:hypothetical protein